MSQLKGVDEVVRLFRALPAELRGKHMRNALAAGGRVIRDEARRAAPVLAGVRIRKADGAVVRKPGTVRDAISVRTSKQARRAGNVGVFINVRPAKGAKFRTRQTKVLGFKRRKRELVRASMRGADNPNDPFYWRFQEFKHRRGGGVGFMQAAAGKMDQALAAVEASLRRAVRRLEKGGR